MSGRAEIAAAPTVSVCVPIYNGAKYLEACLAGIAAQTFSDFEVLIVDDCSLDDGPTIADAWTKKDPRFRLHVNDVNRGLVGNWNRCIDLARGTWIKFLFQDDLIEPACLATMLAAGQGGGGFVACAREVVYEAPIDFRLKEWFDVHQETLRTVYGAKRRLSADEYSDAKVSALELNIVGEPSVTLIRRDLFERFGDFDPLMVQLCDSEMWNRLACNVGIDYVHEKLVSFRVHRASATQANQARSFRAGAIDEIVEWTRLCESPQHTNFRRYVRSAGRWKSLRRRLMRRINAAFEEARVARQSTPANRSLTEDLEAVLPQLPKYWRTRLIYGVYTVRRVVRARLGRTLPAVRRSRS